MENLTIYQYFRLDHSVIGDTILTCTYVNDAVYYIAVVNRYLKLMMMKRNEVIERDLKCFGERVTSTLQYIPHVDRLFFTTDKSYFVISLDFKEVDIYPFPVHKSDWLLAGEWNSEFENFAAVFESGIVMVFSADWARRQLVALAVSTDDKKADTDVYLGWGKRSEQFRGQIARLAPQSNFKYRYPVEKGRISWKREENIFAVNVTHKQTNERVVRIYDSECVLHFEIDRAKLPGLLEKVWFRSKRNTLASVCQSDTANQYVVLYERNGGYHARIKTGEPQAKIREVVWSTCGNYLAVWNVKTYSQWIDLHSQTCEKWNIKYRVPLYVQNQLFRMNFLPTHDGLLPLELFMGSGYVRYDFITNTTLFTAAGGNTALVTKGNDICTHDFNTCVVPPEGTVDEPQVHMLKTDYFVNKILTHPNLLMVITVDSTETARLYRLEDLLDDALISREVDKIDLSDKFHTIPLSVYKWAFETIDDVITLVAFSAQKNSEFDLKRRINLEDCTVMEECSVARPDTKSKPIKSSFSIKFEGDRIKVALTTSGDLTINATINGTMSAQDVSSIYNLDDKFLLMTKVDSTQPFDVLSCVHYKNLAKGNLESISFTRRIEKGAVIVCVCEERYKTVLCMPRGNLEIITVRPIVLTDLHDLIKSDDDYEAAVKIMKSNALKLDLVHDLAPQRFESNLGPILTALRTEEAVIKFLMELDDASVLNQVDCFFVPKAHVENKRKTVLETVLDFLYNQQDQCAFFKLIVMTVWVINEQCNVETLKYFSTLIDGRYKEAASHIEDAIGALATYDTGRDLYTVALSIYDFKLAEMIARKTQMDPQLYLDFLKRIRSVDDLSRRFMINDEIGSYATATRYLVIMYRKKKKTMSDLIEYAEEKHTVRSAFEALTPLDGKVFVRISDLMAKQLLDETHDFKEASTILVKAGLVRQAVDVLRTGHRYIDAAFLIRCCPNFDPVFKNEQYLKIAESCKSAENYSDAASIYFDYIRNEGLGFECLLEGYHFGEVLKRSCTDNRSLVPKMIERMKHYYGLLADKYSDLNEKFRANFERLKVVREIKVEKIRAHVAGDANAFDDAYSEASTRLTKTTTMTSKTSKLQRKIRSLRQGSRYEDIALLRELFETTLAIFELAKEVEEYHEIAQVFLLEDTLYLRKNVSSLQRFIQEVADKIWIPLYLASEQVLTESYELCNIVLLDTQFRRKPDVLSDESKYIAVFNSAESQD